MNWAGFSDRRIRICCPANNKKTVNENKSSQLFYFWQSLVDIWKMSIDWFFIFLRQSTSPKLIHAYTAFGIWDVMCPNGYFMIGEMFIRNISDFPLKAHLSGIFFSGCASCFFTSFFIFIISPSVSVVKYARNSYREAEKEIIIFSGGCKKRFFLMILILYF